MQRIPLRGLMPGLKYRDRRYIQPAEIRFFGIDPVTIVGKNNSRRFLIELKLNEKIISHKIIVWPGETPLSFQPSMPAPATAATMAKNSKKATLISNATNEIYQEIFTVLEKPISDKINKHPGIRKISDATIKLK